MSSWATQDDPNLPFFVRWILRPLMIKTVLDSLYKMEEYIKTTELNYTVVRPGGLSNGKFSLTRYLRIIRHMTLSSFSLHNRRIMNIEKMTLLLIISLRLVHFAIIL